MNPVVMLPENPGFTDGSGARDFRLPGLRRVRLRADRLLRLVLCLLIALPALPGAAWASVAAAVVSAVGVVKEGPAAKKSTAKKTTTAKTSTTAKKPVAKSTTAKKPAAKTTSKSTAKSTSKSTVKKSTSTAKSTKSGKKTTVKKKTTKKRSHRRGKSYTGRASTSPYASAIVIDHETGAVLFDKDPDAVRAPASLTKMMTELIALEALERGEVALDDTLIVASSATKIGGSKIYLQPGEALSFGECLHAMVIASANDAASAIAIHLAGSEASFVGWMNTRAEQLGMARTKYVNPHGLDRNGEQTLTSARDQATLARHLISHPLALRISSSPTTTIRGGQVVHTTNRLLGQVDGCDGLKTGYTGKAGFCLASTVCRNETRVVSVLLGAPSSRGRFGESTKLLENAFSKFQRVRVMSKGADTGRMVGIDGGSPSELKLVASEDVDVVLRSGNKQPITVRVESPDSFLAPIVEGETLGMIEVLVGDSVAVRVPAITERWSRTPTPLRAMGGGGK